MHFITFFVSVFAASALVDQAFAACDCELTSPGCVDTCINNARQCMSGCNTEDLDQLDNLGDCINKCLDDNWPGVQFTNAQLKADVQDEGGILDEDISKEESGEEQDLIAESTDPEVAEAEAVQGEDSEAQEGEVEVKAAVSIEEDPDEEAPVEEASVDEAQEQSVESDQAEEASEAQIAEVEENTFENYVEDETADAEEFGNRRNIFAVTGNNHQEEAKEAGKDGEEYYDVTQNGASASGKDHPTQTADDHAVVTVTEYTTMTSHLTVMPNGAPASSANPSRGTNAPDANSAVSMRTSGAIVTVMALACTYLIA
ncbi:hypothetical protein BJV82DRAFT_635736 [Fennellomyces sp. T-0311]|nr:hypothetical protein BJV82DRAFT_635736 [Fennellomyces sp. T-0311]